MCRENVATATAHHEESYCFAMSVFARKMKTCQSISEANSPQHVWIGCYTIPELQVTKWEVSFFLFKAAAAPKA